MVESLYRFFLKSAFLKSGLYPWPWTFFFIMQWEFGTQGLYMFQRLAYDYKYFKICEKWLFYHKSIKEMSSKVSVYKEPIHSTWATPRAIYL